LSQRFAAAFLAISRRRSGVILAARALPPCDPSSAAADFAESSSSVSSPVAIRMILTALPITSAGRFSPRGPLGMYEPALRNLLAIVVQNAMADNARLPDENSLKQDLGLRVRMKGVRKCP
jgi:hypothetical protein